MKSVKITNPGESAECISILITDYHEEYPIPDMEHVTIRKDWDGYEAEEVLMAAHPELSDKEIDKLRNAAFKKICCTEHSNGTPYFIIDESEIDQESRSTIWHITFWTGNDPHIIQKYFAKYYFEVDTAIAEAGGDDDFYDYMPNFVNTFRQFCELFDYKEEYNELIKKYITQERYEDHNIYVEEIK